MNKLKEILISYATAFNPTEEQKIIAEQRLGICMDCEEWAKDAIVQHCKACGCATKIKVFTPVGSGACPRSKWTI